MKESHTGEEHADGLGSNAEQSPPSCIALSVTEKCG